MSVKLRKNIIIIIEVKRELMVLGIDAKNVMQHIIKEYMTLQETESLTIKENLE